MACDPQELISEAACFSCVTPGFWPLLELQLLCDIQAAIEGGSSGSGGLAGAGDPEGVTTASPGTTYLNTTDESFWVKKTGVGNTGWIKLIGV